ncbi:MAG TPA: hypothetical protein VH419_00025 [Nocardioidaceae bacterium]|jgi:GNAT superfamily N-acetyltransferase
MSESVVPSADEHLTDGWEPELAADDTLLRQCVLVHASWPVAVASSTGRPWHRDDRWAGAWIGDRGWFTNLACLLRPPDDPGSIVREIGEVIPAHVPYTLLNPWPGDLSPYGLRLIGHPPLMVRFPGPAAPPLGVDVREVHDADHLAVAEQVLVEGYPMPELQPLSRGDLFGPAILGHATRVWLGFVDGEPVSVAAAHHDGGVTLVEYVAALPAARGRGAGAAVTWAATLSEPTAPAVLIASDDGRPVYARMGYRAIERWHAWVRIPEPRD